MVGIKYMKLIEIGSVVIEIRGVENGKLAVPVNNTSVHHTAFLAADTQPCVLIHISWPDRYKISNTPMLKNGKTIDIQNHYCSILTQCACVYA